MKNKNYSRAQTKAKPKKCQTQLNMAAKSISTTNLTYTHFLKDRQNKQKLRVTSYWKNKAEIRMQIRDVRLLLSSSQLVSLAGDLRVSARN